jgi:hypothetical protein
MWAMLAAFLLFNAQVISQVPISSEERVKKGLETPITFYGKVTDQNGEAIADAKVQLRALDNVDDKKDSNYETHSDAKGLFSLRNAHGFALTIFVSKDGFASAKNDHGKSSSSGIFWFVDTGEGVYQPDEKNPVLFVLRKPEFIGANLKARNKNVRIARDGSPAMFSMDKNDASPAHALVFRCWNDELNARPRNQREYDWKLEVSVAQGELQVRTDASTFQAPTQGYGPSDTISMPSNLGRAWRDSAQKSYFVRFQDGTFARIDLDMRAGGDHFAVLKSYWNPQPNDRKLEAAPKGNK